MGPILVRKVREGQGVGGRGSGSDERDLLGIRVFEPAEDLVPEEALVYGVLVSGVAGEQAALLVEFVQARFHEVDQIGGRA